MPGRSKQEDGSFEQIIEEPCSSTEHTDVDGRASGSRLRSLVGSALESAAGALPSWFTASSPDKPEADAPSASCPPQGASGTLNPPPTASASSRRRASSYDELLDDESAAGHGSSQSSNGRLQQPVSGKGNFGDGTASVMQQSHSNGVAELSPVAAEGQVSPASISERRSAKGTSPIKQLRERMSKSQPRINFDDATFAGLDTFAVPPAEQYGGSPPARKPPPSKARSAKALRSQSAEPPLQETPALIRARAASMEPAGLAASAIAIAAGDSPAGGSWFANPSFGARLKPSPLYNRLPSDEWASQLLADDSAMDASMPAADSIPSRTPLQDGTTKFSAFAGSALQKSSDQANASADRQASGMQATPQSRSLPTQGASPPPSAPHSRDTAYSASSLRSEPSEASHSSMQSFSTSSMRRLDLGAQSSVGDQTGDLYDIFEPRSSVEQEGGPGAEHDPAATWRLRDVEAVKLLTGQQALEALELGAPVRKKWVTHLTAEAARSATRTLRHLKCQLQGSAVTLQYWHQGVKGLLDKTEVTASVQKVEVSSGSWASGADIRIFSSKGVLSIQASNPATFALWSLGLNAALAVSHSKCKSYLLSRPLHVIPRDYMFLIAEDSHLIRG